MASSPVSLQLGDAALDVLRHLEEIEGAQAWVVGGWVRDSLLGLPSKDVDFAINVDCQQVVDHFSSLGYTVFPRGYNTATIVRGSDSFDVTTFRVDEVTADHRHPGAVRIASSIEEDLKRRDFTLNAIACHPNRGLVDPFGGREDMARGVLRTPIDAELSIQDDYLRMLRAVRFASRHSLRLDEALASAIRHHVSEVGALSNERIGAELNAMAAQGTLGEAYRLAPELFQAIIPELSELAQCKQATKYHNLNALEHTLKVADYTSVFAGQPDAVLGWAALFHDIAKLSCETFSKDGQAHYFGHPGASERVAERYLKKFAIPGAESAQILALVGLHDEELKHLEAGLLGLLAKLEARHVSLEPTLWRLFILMRADAAAKAPPYNHYAREVDGLERRAFALLQAGVPYSVGLLKISGTDLLAAGWREGKEVGEALFGLLEAVQSGSVANETDALMSEAIYQRNKENLLAYLRGVPCRRADSCEERYLGLEIERFVMDDDQTVFYLMDDDRPGVRELLAHWLELKPEAKPILVDETLLGLECSVAIGRSKHVGATITLEPGSQLEMSVGPSLTAEDLYRALQELTDQFGLVCKGLGVDYHLVAAGVNPVIADPHDVPLLPKKRYHIMDEKLGGRYSADMMRLSASTQVSLDITHDATKEYQLAVALSPVIALMCANSGMWRGKVAPFARVSIWRDVSEGRCGVVPSTFSDSFNAQSYLDWLLHTPAMLFKNTRGEVEATDKTVDELLHGELLSNEQLATIVSIVFPDVRVKGYLELRSADAMSPHLAAGLAAFLKGLFYRADAFDAAFDLVAKDRDEAQVREAEDALLDAGWQAKLYGRPAFALIANLFDLALKGLHRQDKKFAEAFKAWVYSAEGASFDEASGSASFQ